MNVLVDSSVWIDFLNGTENSHSNRLAELLSTELVSIGDVILMEILQGIKSDRDFQKTKTYLSELSCYNLHNYQLAIKGAEYFRFLRSKGITVRKTMDTIIATFCIQNDFHLLHNDKDFTPFEKYLKLKTVDL